MKFCKSLMYANLCRWRSYCWKMDCLIKHIIRHICCLASQIWVVFCTNFLVKFVNVHVIFVLGHRARYKFLACRLVPSQFGLFLRMNLFSLGERKKLIFYQKKISGSLFCFLFFSFYPAEMISFFVRIAKLPVIKPARVINRDVTSILLIAPYIPSI